MRRTIAITLAAAATLGLTACGAGTTADLSQDKAKSALLEASDLPDGGWTAGAIDEKKPSKDTPSADQIFKGAQGVSQECKDAMKNLSTLATGDASSYAKRTYSKGTDKDKSEVDVVVEATAKAKDVPGALEKVANTCKTVTMGGGSGGMETKIVMDSPSLKTADAKALQMTMSLMGQTMSMTMAATTKGNNLIVTQSNGKDAGKVKDLVDTILGKQADKVEKAAS